MNYHSEVIRIDIECNYQGNLGNNFQDLFCVSNDEMFLQALRIEFGQLWLKILQKMHGLCEQSVETCVNSLWKHKWIHR